MVFRRINTSAPASPPPPSPAAQEAEIDARVRAEIARLRGEAQAQGLAKGEAEGRAAYTAKTQALDDAAKALRAAAAQLAAPLAQKETELAELATNLAMIIARHVIGVEAIARPEGLARLVAQLLEEAAAERAPRQSLVLTLHPEDAKPVQDLLDLQTVTLRHDAAIERGGARVELLWPDGDPVNRTEWDATLPSRLAAVAASLGLPETPAPADEFAEEPAS